MKLYVISTKYQPLVTVNMPPSLGKKPVSKKSVSTHDLQKTFNASKNDTLIAFDNKDDALVVMSLLIKKHNTTPDFIERGVSVFAVPVIYTVEVDSAALSDQTTLMADDLVNYADTTTIPLYFSYDFFKDAEKSLITEGLQQYSKEISIHKLAGLQLKAVTNASYLNSSATNVIDVNLRPVMERIFSFFQGLIPDTQTKLDTDTAPTPSTK